MSRTGPTLNKFARLMGVLAVSALLANSASACSREGQRCLPAALVAFPDEVVATGIVKVSCPAVDCELGLGADAKYSMVLQNEADPSSQTEPLSVDVAADGSFEADLPVPDGFPVGAAQALVTGGPLDACDDRGSCAAYLVPVQITGDNG